MSGSMDIISLIREKDTFAQKLGIKVLEAEGGASRVAMELGPDTCNALGNVHGGVIFSIADIAFASACNSEGIVSVAIEATAHYMAPLESKGRLEARARKERETRRLGFYRIEVYPPGGDIIAVIQAIAYKKGNAGS